MTVRNPSIKIKYAGIQVSRLSYVLLKSGLTFLAGSVYGCFSPFSEI